MGFSHPRLSLNLQSTLTKEFAGFDSIFIKLGLEPGESREKAKGPFQISGQKKGQERLHCEGDLELTQAALGFQNLRLFQAGRRGKIQAEGEIAFSERPKLWLKANVSQLDLAPELGMATDLSGRVEIKGSVDRYKGQATFINRSGGWEKARDGLQLSITLAPAKRRQAAQQGDGIRMPRIAEDLTRWPFFHQGPGIKHADAVAQIGDNTEVVTDKQNRGVKIALELLNEVQDFRFHGDIKSRCRFV